MKKYFVLLTLLTAIIGCWQADPNGINGNGLGVLSVLAENETSDKSPYDFGSVSSQAVHNFKVTNTGTGPIELMGVDPESLGEAFSFLGGTFPGTGGDCSIGQVLEANEDCRIAVQFLPFQEGAHEGAIVLLYKHEDTEAGSLRLLKGIGVIGADTVQRVFVTSHTYDGNLGGENGANAKCQESARAGNLPGEWQAILSGEGYPVPYSIVFARNIHDVKGRSVINPDQEFSPSHFLYGPFGNPIEYDEFGNTVDGTKTWVGAPPYSPMYTYNRAPCENWTQNASNYRAYTGNPQSLGYERFSSTVESCSQKFRLYCIQKIAVPKPTEVVATTGIHVAGDVDFQIKFPLTVANYQRFFVLRRNGTTAASSCYPQAGLYSDYNPESVALIYEQKFLGNEANTTLSFTDSTGNADVVVSYNVCVEVPGQNAIEVKVENIRTKAGELAFEHRLFVTEGLYTGNMGGAEGADAICGEEALNAGYSQTQWKAILSTSMEDAKDRFEMRGAVANTRGDFLAGNQKQFLAGVLPNLILGAAGSQFGRYDERVVMTATDLGGERYVDTFYGGVIATCGDWTSTEGSYHAGVLPIIEGGVRNSYSWSYFLSWSDINCKGYARNYPTYEGVRVYCISQ